MLPLLIQLGCAEPLSPTPACVSYVSCLEARDATLGIQTDAVRFDVGGDCWGNDEIAALCDRACDNGLAWMRAQIDDLPGACLP